METRILSVEEISESSFAGYGRYVRTGQQEPAAKLIEFSFWNKLSVLNHTSTSIGLVEVHKQTEAVSTIFEQHVRTTETLIPADGEVILVLAKPMADDEKQIDFDTVRAFRVQAGDAVVLDRAVWHFAPHPVDGSVKIWVIFEEDTPDNDLFMRHVDEEHGIRFVVAGA